MWGEQGNPTILFCLEGGTAGGKDTKSCSATQQQEKKKLEMKGYRKRTKNIHKKHSYDVLLTVTAKKAGGNVQKMF